MNLNLTATNVALILSGIALIIHAWKFSFGYSRRTIEDLIIVQCGFEMIFEEVFRELGVRMEIKDGRVYLEHVNTSQKEY